MQELPPQHYLLCNGQEVSRTDYAELFAIIGTTWGAGNGSTTFNVPNLQGRTTIGVGTNDGTTYNLGSRDGSKDAVIVSHWHEAPEYVYGTRWDNTSSLNTRTLIHENVGLSIGDGNNHNIAWDAGNYQHVVKLAGTTTTIVGESGTDKNMMPYGVMNKIIRAK